LEIVTWGRIIGRRVSWGLALVAPWGCEGKRHTLLTGVWVSSDGTKVPSGTSVWTGGDVNVAPTAGQSCGDWQAPSEQGVLGNPQRLDQFAFGITAYACDTPAGVYCIER